VPHGRRAGRATRTSRRWVVSVAALTLAVVASASAAVGPRWLPSRRISPTPSRGYIYGGPSVAMNARGDATVFFGASDPARNHGRVEAVLRPAGRRYTAPVPVDVPASAVAIGGAGQVIAVGARGDAIAPSPQRVVALAGSTRSRSFGTPVTIGSPGPSDSDFSPRVAMNDRGDGVVTWARKNPHELGILTSIRRAGQRFGRPETIPGSSGEDPQVGIDARGDVTVAWFTRAGNVLAVDVAVRPAGGHFGPPVTVSRADQDLGAFNLAVSPTGEAAIASILNDGSINVVLRGRRGPFGARRTLERPTNDYLTPVVSIDARGEAVVAWGRPYEGVVRVAVRSPGHGFGPSTTLSAPGETSGAPALAGVGAGHFVVAWPTRTRSGRSYVVARVRAGGRPFGPQRPVTRLRSLGEGFDFGVAIDALGDALAVTAANDRVLATDYRGG